MLHKLGAAAASLPDRTSSECLVASAGSAGRVQRMREPGLGGRFSAIRRLGRERMIARSDGRGVDVTGRECDPGVDFVRVIANLASRSQGAERRRHLVRR